MRAAVFQIKWVTNQLPFRTRSWKGLKCVIERKNKFRSSDQPEHPLHPQCVHSMIRPWKQNQTTQLQKKLVSHESKRKMLRFLTYNFQFAFWNSADAIRSKVGISGLDAAQAAEVLIALLLPFSNQILVCIALLYTVVIQLCQWTRGRIKHAKWPSI